MGYIVLFGVGFLIGLAWRKAEPEYRARYYVRDE